MGQQPLQGFHLVVSANLCCLHNTRLQPSYLTLNIGPTDAVPRHARRCTRPCCSVQLLSLRLDGSINSLVKRDHKEVGPISREVILQPLSIPLQNGLRFFLVPLPAAPTVFLTVHLPFPATQRAYPVPHLFLSGADPSSSPAAHCPRWLTFKEPYLAAYLLVQACQHIWLVNRNDVYQRFTFVDRTRSSLAPIHPCAGRIRLPSRVGVPR